MNKSTLTAIAAVVGLALGAPAMASTFTKAEYQSAKKGIAADYKSAKAACDPLKANTKDICKAHAKGMENVALAELEARYEPSQKHSYEVRLAKAEANYSVAREKCDDQAGNAKDVCVKEAKAALIAAKADAKTQMKTADANRAAGTKITEARKDAATDKRDAGYAVAREKCDALAGSAKDQCVNDAKARYGKS